MYRYSNKSIPTEFLHLRSAAIDAPTTLTDAPTAHSALHALTTTPNTVLSRPHNGQRHDRVVAARSKQPTQKGRPPLKAWAKHSPNQPSNTQQQADEIRWRKKEKGVKKRRQGQQQHGDYPDAGVYSDAELTPFRETVMISSFHNTRHKSDKRMTLVRKPRQDIRPF